MKIKKKWQQRRLTGTAAMDREDTILHQGPPVDHMVRVRP